MSTKTLRRALHTALAALFTIGCGEAPEPHDPFEARVASGPLKIATWNMEWLNRSNNTGPVKRTNADYQKLAEYAEALDADIIAVQEVDGPEAAIRVFDPGVYDVHMSSRNHTQRTGFVYRKQLDVTIHPDYTALDVGSLRYGTDIEVDVGGGQSLRLLSVHLKAGCLSQSLGSGSSACNKLAQQADILEDWIDARAAQGVPLMVLGDFNRRFFASNNDQFWAEIDDGSPAGADLSSPTQTGSALCNNGQHPEFIDHLVTGTLATAAIAPGSFEQLLYSNADSGYDLSDHCPLSIELDFEGGPPPASSCVGSCGGQSPGGCWCDDLCESFGNCCADKAAVCDAPPPDPDSCEGHCGAQAPGGCWCDDACVSFGNCCADKVAACGSPPPDPDSCEGHCGGQAPGGCWCDSACSFYGDCCDDESTQCG